MTGGINPFGTDAETVEYAAGQVNLPALAIQLRRIAAAMRTAPAPRVSRPKPRATGKYDV